MDPNRVTPRDIIPNWDRAIVRCLDVHRLPPQQIPCVECQKAVQ